MDQAQCDHNWVAGMMVVNSEDVASIAAMRRSYGEHVSCSWCGLVLCGETDITGETICLLPLDDEREHAGPHGDGFDY